VVAVQGEEEGGGGEEVFFPFLLVGGELDGEGGDDLDQALEEEE